MTRGEGRVGLRPISRRVCSGQGGGYRVIITGQQGTKNVRIVIVIANMGS